MFIKNNYINKINIMTVENIGNSVVFNDGTTQYAFPKGTIICTSSKNSKSVNIKLKGSRKTILSFPATEMGFNTAQEAIDYIRGFAY